MAQIFPRWTNEIPKVAPPVLGVLGAFATFAVWFWFSPYHTDVGYQPEQPIPYSHKLHAGDMGMDCRYCHANVEQSWHAGVPPTQTCLNCHNMVKKNSKKLGWLRKQKDENGRPLVDAPSTPWKRIHKIADYAYFDHSAHVTVGVGCKSCHGRIDQMVVVRQVQPLSMGWCLECHRNVKHFEDRGFEPAEVLRPLDKVSVTEMTWPEHEAFDAWKQPARDYAKTLNPPIVQCSGCHR
jgi:hypothetical protein